MDGTIVYQARALYNLINGSVRTFNDNCNSNSETGNGNENARIMNLDQSTNWQVSIFPNPNTGEFNIISQTESENLQVIIKDLNGNILYTQHLLTRNFISKLDLNLINGVYLVTVINSNYESTTKKLVISK